jgi:tRNA(Ile)-lysidine synthase
LKAPTLVQNVDQFFHRHGIPPQGVVAAVSGGPDSVALFAALVRSKALGPPVIVAHLNHQLRGAESDADEAFVRQMCASLAPELVRFRCERIDVAGVARDAGANLESMARKLRYNWLTRLAREERMSIVATGHTADDQAETVLHRLLRGSGWQGLRGIAPVRALAPDVQLVRPLLAVTRAEILDFLYSAGQTFREDTSNQDLRFTRNRIRQELLPLLATRYNPAIVAALRRLAEQAAAVYERQRESARRLLAEAEQPRAGALLVFDRECLARAPRHLVREALRLAWAREAWPLDAMSFDAWERLAAVARGESSAVDLPGRIRARCQGRVVQIGPVA